MSGVDANGKSIFNYPISCSITPAGTDESISEFLLSLEDNDPNLGFSLNIILHLNFKMFF